MSDHFATDPWSGHHPVHPGRPDSTWHDRRVDGSPELQDSPPTKPLPAPGYPSYTGHGFPHQPQPEQWQSQYPQVQYPQPYYGGPAGPSWPGNAPPVVVNAPHVVVTGPPKSVGLAVVLAFFFGPLGMLYSTVTGALVVFLVNLVSIPFTVGFSLLLTWPIGIVWAGVAASMHATGWIPPPR